MDFVDTCAFLTRQDAPSMGCMFIWNIKKLIELSLILFGWRVLGFACRSSLLEALSLIILPAYRLSLKKFRLSKESFDFAILACEDKI